MDDSRHPIEILDNTQKRKLESDLKICVSQPGLSEYPPDTLQEYVMLILKNKKSRIQIADDLAEFMGTHASKFVDWLWETMENVYFGNDVKPLVFESELVWQEKERSKSPKRSRSDSPRRSPRRSPKRFSPRRDRRRHSHSPERRRYSHSPERDRRYSRSPNRRRYSPERRSRSPMRDQRRDNRSPRRDYPRRDNRSPSRMDNRSPQRYGHGREYKDSRDMRRPRESGTMPHEIFNDRRRIPRDFTNDRIHNRPDLKRDRASYGTLASDDPKFSRVWKPRLSGEQWGNDRYQQQEQVQQTQEERRLRLNIRDNRMAGASLSAAHSDVKRDILGQRRQLSLHGTDQTDFKPGFVVDNFSEWMNNRQAKKNGTKNWTSKEELEEIKQKAIINIDEDEGDENLEGFPQKKQRLTNNHGNNNDSDEDVVEISRPILDTKAKIEILKKRCQDKSENVKFTVTIGDEFDNNNKFPERPTNTEQRRVTAPVIIEKEPEVVIIEKEPKPEVIIIEESNGDLSQKEPVKEDLKLLLAQKLQQARARK